jgi:hypothetical protein
LGGQRLALTAFKTLIAAAGMGAAALVAEPVIERAIGLDTLLDEIIVVGGVGGLSVATFVLLAAVLRIEEWRWLMTLVRGKLRG